MTHDATHWSQRPARQGQQMVQSIESGHFVIGLMSSLYCPHDCPHCYLTRKMRRDRTRLAPETLERILRGVADYYADRGIAPTITVHHYGGEPTAMGPVFMRETMDAIDAALPASRGIMVRHSIQSALTGVDLDDWIPIFRDRCDNYVQTSYDGPMRGRRYDRAWRTQVEALRAADIDVATISTINTRLLELGPEGTLALLEELDVCEAGFLVLLHNDNNDGKPYDRLAPSMRDWSAFMIALTEAWAERRHAGGHPPEIGPLHATLWRNHCLSTSAPDPCAVPPALFLMPNGDWAISDYRADGSEYMRTLANGATTPFAEALRTPERRAFLRNQALRNGNPECQSCPLAGGCMMEIWKPNPADGECFGAKTYVEWVLANADRLTAAFGSRRVSQSFF